MNDTLVIIPTFNEVTSLASVVRRTLESAPVDILIVDDASPDGTGDLADVLAHERAQIHVLHRPEKAGIGSAYRDGFAWGLARDYPRFAWLDADGSHLPEQLPKLLDHLGDYDLVTGSRWVPGGRVLNWPTYRELLSRGGNAYARAALGTDVRDSTCGFRAMTGHALRQVDLTSIASQGQCFQVDLLWRALQRGLRVAEVPITFVERVHRRSKMDAAMLREFVALVTGFGLRRRPADDEPTPVGGRRLDSIRDAAPQVRASDHAEPELHTVIA